jgi:GGDEF domain-containing protein
MTQNYCLLTLRLSRQLKGRDMLARLGGDEFAALVCSNKVVLA